MRLVIDDNEGMVSKEREMKRGDVYQVGDRWYRFSCMEYNGRISTLLTGPDDTSKTYVAYLEGYDPKCNYCVLGHSHSTDVHKQERR